jgi:hypothetical protein
MEKLNIKSSKIFIKGIGSTDKGMDSDVFIIPMDADFKEFSAKIKKMEWVL